MRKYRSHRKPTLRLQKNLPLFLFFLSIILIVFLWGLWILQHSLFSTQERVTIAFATIPPTLLSINTTNGEMNLLIIPEDTYLEVPGGFGSYQVGALWKLGQIEKKNGALLLYSLRSFLAAPIDGWVGWPDSSPSPHNLSSMVSILTPQGRASLSNLSISDRILLWWKLSRVKSDKFTTIDLREKGVLVAITLPDGTKARKAEPDIVDKIAQTLYFERESRQIDLPIRIYNSTHSPGLGNKIARLLINVGYRVASVGNTDEFTQACRIEVPSAIANHASIHRLQQIIGCPLQTDSLPAEKNYEGYLVIGDDMSPLW